MEYLVGLALAFGISAGATVLGVDRERSFYATVLIVVASYYVLFAVMGASGRTVAIEIAVAGGFLALAVVGFKKNLWLVAVALAGHGLFDLVHHSFIDNPGVPHWWPGFCLAYDVTAGVWLGARLILGKHVIPA
jgi:hypothetical protein